MMSISTKFKSSSEDISVQISSRKWLSIYGLKKVRLDYEQILSTIGFKSRGDYIKILKRPVSARYSSSVFKKVECRKSGNFYNVTAPKENIQKIELQLQHIIQLYRQRLQWLTSGSCRTFGVVEEKNVCILIDVQDENHQFQMYIEILMSLIKEQISNCANINFIRCASEPKKWQSKCIHVNTESLCDAVDWLTEQLHMTEYTNTCVIESILDAASDKELDAIYLFTNGQCCRTATDILKQRIKFLNIPLHTVLVNKSTQHAPVLLKEISTMTKGRFHYYCGVNESERNCEWNVKLENREKGLGVRSDVMLIWEELDKARIIFTQIQTMISEFDQERMKNQMEKKSKHQSSIVHKENNSQVCADIYLSSKQWLHKHGLKKLNLTLYSYLKASVFDHCDGVLDIKQPSYGGDPIIKPTLINARYCHKFAHLKWSDGSTKHVHITGGVYRKYQELTMDAIEIIRKRLAWLQKGSRQLFGTIIEQKIVLLIDTSSSMSTKLDVVKNKLAILVQEQLCCKEEFNIMQFSTIPRAWRDFLVPCNIENLDNSWCWVNGLTANGSTNTLAAILSAYTMEGVQAIYLLSDGRPDQPPDMIFSRVKNSIPIHTISFNCEDIEANKFLYKLSNQTGGRYHYYFDEIPSNEAMPKPYESEDLILLKQEINQGLHDLEIMLKLRQECVNKASIASLEKNNNLFEKSTLDNSKMISSRHLSFNQPQSSGYYVNKASELRLSKQVKPPTRPRSGVVKSSRALSVSSRPASAMSNAIVKTLDKKRKKKKIKKRIKSPASEIKLWVDENGIRANKLTILDALAPTIIQQKPTYVHAVKKDIISKVYGDILPIVHTSGGKTIEYQIVNPQAVDLNTYEIKLKECLAEIDEKLNEYVWNHLDDDQRSKFSNNNKKDINFSTHRVEILKLFKEFGLLSVIKDIKLLERELNDGKTYLQQSQELRRTVKELAAAKKEEMKFKHPTPPPPRQYTQRKPSPTTSNGNSSRLRYHRVIARNDMDGYYYVAVVDKYVNPRYVNVNFDHGENQLTSVRYVISIGGSIPCPTLTVGDYVLLKAPILSNSIYEDDENVEQCYVPGIVQVTPLRMKSSSKCYTVIRFNGTKMTALRKDMIKITRSKFVFAVRFIQQAHRNHEKEKRQLNVVSSSEESEKEDDEHKSEKDDRSIISSHHNSTPRTNEIQFQDETNSVANDDKDNTSEKDNLSEVENNIPSDNENEIAFENNNGGDVDSLFDGESPEIVQVNPLDEKFEAWKEKLELEHKEKLDELMKQKDELDILREQLTATNDKYTLQQQSLYAEQQKFLHQQIQQQNDNHLLVKEQYKEQVGMFKQQQQQQESILSVLLQQQKESLKSSQEVSSPKLVQVKDEQTLTDIYDVSEELNKSRDDNTPRLDDSLNQSASSIADNLPNHNNGRNYPEYPSHPPQPPEEPDDDENDTKFYMTPNNNAMLMAQGESGVYISRDPMEDESVLKIQTPTLLQMDQEVLARFKDDGWYYRATIKKKVNKKTFLVEDAVGSFEQVYRNDVITDEDDANNIIGVNDSVIALHPRYQYAYAPGIINAVEKDGTLRVHFYDDQVTCLPRDELYMVSPWKYERDCKYIRYKENSLIGQAVICRDDLTGYYHLAAVRGRVTGARNYLIEWANQAVIVQNYAFLFGAHTKREVINEKSFVLAITDKGKFSYLPGIVLEVKGNHMTVLFCDDSTLEDIEVAQSFWISVDYYHSSVNYWKSKRATNETNK